MNLTTFIEHSVSSCNLYRFSLYLFFLSFFIILFLHILLWDVEPCELLCFGYCILLLCHYQGGVFTITWRFVHSSGADWLSHFSLVLSLSSFFLQSLLPSQFSYSHFSLFPDIAEATCASSTPTLFSQNSPTESSLLLSFPPLLSLLRLSSPTFLALQSSSSVSFWNSVSSLWPKQTPRSCQLLNFPSFLPLTSSF